MIPNKPWQALSKHQHLELRVKHLRSKNPAIDHEEYAKVNALFERALVLLNKMPRIWEMFLTFLMQQPSITQTRKAFDQALRALPVPQHPRIWEKYREFATTGSGSTSLHIWGRYTQFSAESIETYLEMLVGMGRYEVAAEKYIGIIGNPTFRSQYGKSHFQLWNELVDILVTHAEQVCTDNGGLDVDKIIRSGIQRFKDQRGKLWTDLATYWITRGSFDKARDIFEEGMASVNTVRDFTIIFDSCAEFEESIIGALMERAAKGSRTGQLDDVSDHDLDVRMMRFEQLMDRRSFLLNDVLLRQDPNNVAEWEKRILLWGPNKREVVQTYVDALAAIEPRQAHGRLHKLWVNYAKFYEAGDDVQSARMIMEKAVKVPFRSVAELAEVWCQWAELELRNEQFNRAVAIMAKATMAPKRSTVDYFDESLSPQQRVHKSWKLWSFYVDLVESVSGLEETRSVYDRIFELRIATPQTIVNFASLLEENGYYEDSFKVYERGLDLFNYPVAFELWNLYLTKAIDRKVSIERLRDLFEQAIERCPPHFAKPLYLMYGNLEEERGLARHAMRIYDRATRFVSERDRFEMFDFYITKSTSNFGLTSTRPIYDRAVTTLPDREAAEMCIKFADMERRLGEVDRARAIYGHASQFCDPRTSPTFWVTWESFEVQHGNEDTFKEMLRIKRSVQAQYKYALIRPAYWQPRCLRCVVPTSASSRRKPWHEVKPGRLTYQRVGKWARKPTGMQWC